MKKFLIFLFLMLVAGTLAAQDDTSAEMPTFSKKHGLYKNAFALYITPSVSGCTTVARRRTMT